MISDITIVSDIGILSKASWGYEPSDMEIFAKELTLTENDLALLFASKVAVSGSDIVGYYTICSHSDETLELEHLFVHPDWFRQGVGVALLEDALKLVKSKGINKVIIIADPNSTGFYVKHGAKIVGEHKSSIKKRIIPVLSMPTVTQIVQQDAGSDGVNAAD